jgi:hypothetical protein
MKKLILLITLALFISAQADFLGIKKSSETISFFLEEPLDSVSGVPRKPDSVHVFTYADNASAATYTARSTTYPFSDVSIDTLKSYGDTTYVFADAITDIDGAGGNFLLAITVRMFTGKWPTDTRATVQVISDSLAQFMVGEVPTNFSTLTIGNNAVNANMIYLSGSSSAADNLEIYFDGTGNSFLDSLFKYPIHFTDYSQWFANDSAMFGWLAFWAGDSSNYASIANFWASSNSGALYAWLDSTTAISGFNPNYYYRTEYAADLDTVWVIHTSDHDTIGIFEYYHPGGAAGDPPDSLKYTRK